MMNEVSRPALAGLWPNKNGMNVVLDLELTLIVQNKIVDLAELGSVYTNLCFTINLKSHF